MTVTVSERFAAAARRWPQRPFLHLVQETAAAYGTTPGDISYADALAEVERLRQAYRQAGYRAGQRVLLLLENRPALVLQWLALNGLGLSIVPVNPALRAAELEYLIGHAEPVLAISVAERAADLSAAAAAAGLALPVIAPDEVCPPNRRPPAPSPAALREAALLYTSGTSGRPQGCALSNRYFLLAGRWYAAAGGLCALNDGERMITPLPLFHMNALAYSLLGMIEVGGCLILLDRFHPSTWWRSVRVGEATCCHYLGVMPALLMAAAPSPDDRRHRLRFGFGAGVDPQLHRAFEQRFGFPLVEAWAMTETGAGAVVAANREPRKPGRACFGRPTPELELRLLTDDGADAAPGQTGELLVRRAGADPRDGFFSHYHKDPQATAAVWRDGWFHTGDVVRRDADGDLYFVDRKKNLIRRSGENIAAVEVESELNRLPRVSAAAVAAVADPLRGEEVLACIVADPPPADAEREPLAAQIVAGCLARLAYFKVPGYVAFVERLPLTATQKIQRGKLKNLARGLPGAPTTVDTRALKKRPP